VVCDGDFCRADSANPDCCADACTNIENDPNNCGACGTRCGLQQVCESGGCACPCDDFACLLLRWGSTGTGNGQFRDPYGVAVAPDGTVYVTDQVGARIQRFEADGDYILQWGTSGSLDGQFINPTDVAVAPAGSSQAGRVYVADTNNRRIQFFDANGSFLGKWSITGPISPFPFGIGVAPDGTVYVADVTNNRIQRFSENGDVLLNTWGSPGAGNGQFNNPFDVAVAPAGSPQAGRVYVVDQGNDRIQFFSATGAYQGQWGGSGNGDGQFTQPLRVVVGPDGTVYVTDPNTGRVQAFTPDGAFLGKWVNAGGSYGVAAAADGTVYVTDLAFDRVSAYCVTVP
jgi:DNA-binding beta-propeller fold protein YncE